MEKLHLDDKFIEKLDKTSFWDFKSKYEFVDQWFLMGSPYPLLVISTAYLLFVLKLGPEYMKNRRPFTLKNVLLAYNILQVGVSAWMTYLCLEVILKIGVLQRTCLTDTEESIHRLTTLTYYYFSCKISELLDTIFFVLRKKQKQVTFLHVYHHGMMVWNGWVFLKYEPGYWMVFLGFMNCFIHVLMYAYYGLSAYPSLQKYLWWKKYLTSLQLLQFALILVQMTGNLFVNECTPSRWTMLYFYFNVMLFFYMFLKFYRSSYSQDDKKTIKNGTNKTKSKLDKNGTQENGTKYKNGNAKKNGDYFTNGFKNHTNETNHTESYFKNSRENLKNRN